ncbi:MAG TPA: L,D-transpeptidase, partial [Thermodesulfobacteriota bacterium]|nr:L,D-transpeptidase [Thermodesulfobacteriota bacterium]
CIRLYPEDIEKLFPMISLKTPVEMIYEPVKIGFHQGRIFSEVHPDIYGKVPDLVEYGLAKVRGQKWEDRVDLNLFSLSLREAKGIPVDITRN